jgi:glycosyltransferase involved in cell wall biosynthesis
MQEIKSLPSEIKLSILTHVPHYQTSNGQLLAFGPYVKEINAFGGMFSSLIIVAPRSRGQATNDSMPYTHPNINWIPCRLGGGHDWRGRLSLATSLPSMVKAVWRGMRSSDALHIRCPGNMGLLGTLMAQLTQQPRFAKYAGEWDDFQGEAATVRWQKRLLARTNFGGPVTYYGSHERNQSAHFIPFFASSMTDDEIAAARAYAEQKQLTKPVRILFAGRLSYNRGVDVLLQAIAMLNARQPNKYRLIVAGDGQEKQALHALSETLGMTPLVQWLGWQPLPRVYEEYKKSHIVCMPTRMTESWGKTLQEGMAYGAIPIASAIGGLRRQLKNHSELLVAPDDAEALASTIVHVTSTEKIFETYKHWAIEQATLWSLDRLAIELQNLLQEWWQVELPPLLES